MYDELVKRLWECASGECFNCSQYTETTNASVCSKELMKQAADAIEELSAIREEQKAQIIAMAAEDKPRWIPVTERLPERGQDVLVMVHWRDYPEDMMCYGRKYKTRWYLWNGELGELINGFDITHWMPLPQPPKEE